MKKKKKWEKEKKVFVIPIPTIVIVVVVAVIRTHSFAQSGFCGIFTNTNINLRKSIAATYTYR